MSNSKSSNNNRRRSRRNRGVTTSIPRPFTLPLSITTQEYYVDTRIMTVNATFSRQVFRLNSTFDPDYTNAGHQPYGRDQLAALYAKYRVMALAYHINFTSVNGIIGTIAALPILNAVVEASTGTQYMIENPLCKWGSSVGGLITKWSNTINLPKFLGQTPAVYRGDDSNESVVGASPSSVANLIIGFDSNSGATTTCEVTIRFTYVVEYFELINQASS